MAGTRRSSRRRRSRRFLVQKAEGQLGHRVQAVGPEHFGIVSVDCGKDASKYMFADFYGRVLIPPTEVAHDRNAFRAAIDRIRLAAQEQEVRDLVVAIERTGQYHHLPQCAFRDAGWEVRLVHALASKHFRQPADPGNKSDDTDLAGTHRAAVNGFGLVEAIWPNDYQQLQQLIRHRRDLVGKNTRLRCQIKEKLHATMPGYATLFGADVWLSPVALPIVRATGSAAAVRQAGLPGLKQIVAAAGVRCRESTLIKVLTWAESAAEGHPQANCLHRVLTELDDDRLAKTQQITVLERSIASLLVRTPFVLLLSIPAINVVSAADLAGEMGPIDHYADANRITGRAGLVPCRYQSSTVDHSNGPLRRHGNHRLRHALMQIADNLVTINHYFQARAARWYANDKDARWVRVKVAKIFSRLAFVMLRGPRLFPHACCQPRHYILDKLLRFQQEHNTPMATALEDLHAAIEQLPKAARPAEADVLKEQLRDRKASRRGPQPLATIIPLVLARLGVAPLQSERGDRDPS